MLFSRVLSGFLVAILACAAVDCGAQEITPEIREELSELSKELRTVSALVRRNETEEARAIVRKASERATELAIPADSRDRSWAAFVRMLESARRSLPISFEQQVAPILKEKCTGCHGADNARGNLRMHTFRAMTAGSTNGPLLQPRNPRGSLIMARIINDLPNAPRMPRGGEQLSEEEINAIGYWIQQGARYDGTDMDGPIGQTPSPMDKPKIEVVMADGTETVSFMNDVAPWLINTCFSCHSGNNPRAGFSMENFELLLQGGESGSTISPGSPDDSYICDLVVRQEPIKMPPGQALIKRSQADTLVTWIREGAHFDGRDPKARLRDVVPTPDEMERQKMLELPDSEFAQRRMEQAEALWKRVAPRDDAASHTTDDFYFYGNVTEDRLKELAATAEAQLASLRTAFPQLDGTPVWRGRLNVLVAGTRFDYEEANTVLLDRQVTPALHAHALISPNVLDAYVVIEDTGVSSDETTIPAESAVRAAIAEAYLNRTGANLPDWLQAGFGLIQAEIPADSPFAVQSARRAAAALGGYSGRPNQLFRDGVFPPGMSAEVGSVIVRFLQRRGRPDQFLKLISELRAGTGTDAALQSAYGSSAAEIATALLRSL